MPIYSLVALILSLFGATYTGISALRSYFNEAILEIARGANKRVAAITSAGPDSAGTAQKYGFWIRFWSIVWKFSHLVPIIVFLVICFSMGIYCLCNWNAVTQPPALSPLSSGVQTTVTDSCIFGWWILLLTLSANGLCALAALISRWKVMSNGKHLDDLHKVAEGMSMNLKVEKAVASGTIQPPRLGQ